MINSETVTETKENYAIIKKVVCQTMYDFLSEEKDSFKTFLQHSKRQRRKDHGKVRIDHVVGYLKDVLGHYEVYVVLNLQNFIDGKMDDLLSIRMWFSNTIYNEGHYHGKDLIDVKDEHFVSSLSDMTDYIKVFRYRENAVRELSLLLHGEGPSSRHAFVEADVSYH